MAGGPKQFETILLVEDADLVRDLVIEQLSSEGYRVLAAASGDEAIAIAHGGHIDVLLTDVEMPGMSGPELAIRLLDSNPQLAVILSSGRPTGPAEEALLERPATAFIEKPYERETLMGTIRAVLNQT